MPISNAVGVAVRRNYGTTVTTIADLRAVTASERFSNQLVYVAGVDATYEFEPASVGVDDGDLILEPDDSPATGRWEKRGAGIVAPADHAPSHVTGGGDVIANAVAAGNAGLMSGVDKTKLNGIEALAQVNVAAPVTSVFGRVGVVTALVGDYQHSDIIGLGPNDHHPEAHAMGAGAHLADTLVALNAKVSDATLIDTGDSRLSDARTPLAHRASHISGGGDAFLSTDVLEAVVKRIQTSTGPTTLTVGAVADGEFLKRVGSTIVGAAAGGASLPVVDTTSIVEDPVDSTKEMRIDVGAVATLTVRTLIMPDNDVNVVDSAEIMLLDGTQTMTGTMTTLNVVPAADNTHFIGSDTAVYASIRTSNIRPKAGTSLTINDGDDFIAITVFNGGDIRFTPVGELVLNPVGNVVRPAVTSDIDLGTDILAFKNVFTRIIKADSGNSLEIRQGNGTTWADVTNAGNITFFQNTGMTDDFVSFWGASTDAQMKWSTAQVPNALLLTLSGSNVFIIGDSTTPNLAIPNQTNPTLVVHDGSISTGTWGSIAHDGTDLLIVANIGAVLLNGIAPILANGTVSLTAQWNVGDQIISGINALRPDGSSGSKSIGGTGNAWGTVFTRTIRADNTQSLLINRSDGVTWATVTSGGNTIIAVSTTINDDIRVNLGTGNDFQWIYETVSQTNHTLLLGTQGAEGNTVVFTDKVRFTLNHVVGTPTTPTWRFHDGSVTAGNYGSITHDGTNLAIVVNAGDLEVTGNVIPEADGTRSLGISTAVYGTTWTRVLRPDSGSDLTIIAGNSQDAFSIQTGAIEINPQGLNRDLIVQGDNDPVTLTVDAGLDYVGVGTPIGTKLAKLQVDQSLSGGAVPVLALDQGDIDDSFINFIGTSAADSSRSISSSTATAAAKVGAILCELNGVTGWIRLWASAV